MNRIIEITDICAPELDVYARLTDAQLKSRRHPEQALCIAESRKVIEAALGAGCVPVSMLMERSKLDGGIRGVLAKYPDLPVYTGESALLEELTGFRLSRGILCAMRRPPQPDAAQLCSTVRRLAVLENIVDPTNVGAIFRSAAALGMDAVLVSPECCDPLHRRAARVSMGAVFQIPWARFDGDWRASGVRSLQAMGFKAAALALSDRSISIDDPLLPSQPKLAVLLGSEGDGLSAETIEQCDFTVRIPMRHGVDSLNVAAASAVAFWQLCRE